MKLAELHHTDKLISSVEKILEETEGVSAQSLYNNEHREVPSTIYVAKNDKEIVFVAETHPLSDEIISIINLTSTAPGKGIGQKGLSLLETEITSIGYKIIRLTSTEGSYGFYIKMGYEPSGECEFSFRKHCG